MYFYSSKAFCLKANTQRKGFEKRTARILKRRTEIKENVSQFIVLEITKFSSMEIFKKSFEQKKQYAIKLYNFRWLLEVRADTKKFLLLSIHSIDFVNYLLIRIANDEF